jgi:hypothetical protein
MAPDLRLIEVLTRHGVPFVVVGGHRSLRPRGPSCFVSSTLAIGAVAGFNPAVVAGKIVASNSGIADVTQQRRMADEIAAAVADAVNARAAVPAR